MSLMARLAEGAGCGELISVTGALTPRWPAKDGDSSAKWVRKQNRARTRDATKHQHTKIRISMGAGKSPGGDSLDLTEWARVDNGRRFWERQPGIRVVLHGPDAALAVGRRHAIGTARGNSLVYGTASPPLAV